MKENEASTIIDSNNKLFLVYLNSLEEFNETNFIAEYEKIRERLLSSKANNIFSNWLKYISKNIDIIDVRMESI